MALIRWEPVPTAARTARAATRRWVPAVDVAEHDDHYVLHADLPGLAESDVDLSLEADVLTLSGRRTREQQTERDGYVRVERATGAFSRSFTLPEGVDGDAITATFDKGVLAIHVPKPEARRPRKLQIHVGDAPAQIEDAAAEQAATS